MNRYLSDAHLRLWMKRQSLPGWATLPMIVPLLRKPSAIDECVNANFIVAGGGFGEGFVDAERWQDRKKQVDATLHEIKDRMQEAGCSAQAAIRSMFEGEETRREGDLRKWMSRLLRPDPDDILRMWQCHSCFQCFERRPRRRCPECGAATSNQSRPA